MLAVSCASSTPRVPPRSNVCPSIVKFDCVFSLGSSLMPLSCGEYTPSWIKSFESFDALLPLPNSASSKAAAIPNYDLSLPGLRKLLTFLMKTYSIGPLGVLVGSSFEL